jgi:uncharacterized protein (DUF433 family)
MKFTRITVDSGQMGGTPCIRSLRIPVTTVVSMIAEGMTELEILQSLLYAARLLQEGELPLAS